VTLTADGKVTANFAENAKYLATVESGSGSGSYYAGATVEIIAKAPPAGKTFDKWTSADVTFANENAATTSFVMPEGDVTVEATYKCITYTITLISRRGKLADASGWELADGQYTRTFEGVLEEAVVIPAVTPDNPADWEFGQWRVVAYDGTDDAFAPGQVVAQLPVGFVGNITLRADFNWIGPNPSPWYPVYDLGEVGDGPRQVKVYRGDELVTSMVVRGAQVKPADYLKVGCPGLLSGVDYTFKVSKWNSDELCFEPDIVTPEYQLPETGAVVAGPPDGDNVVVLNIDLPLASKYRLSIRKGREVYLPATESVFVEANEDGFVLPNSVRQVEFFMAGIYDVTVLAINPLGEAVQAASCQVVIAKDGQDGRDSWPVAGFMPLAGQNILLGGDTTPVLFSWPAIVWGESYELLVYDGNGNEVAVQRDLLDCHATVTLPAGVYFWRVVAIDAAGQELSSPGQDFAVVAQNAAPILSHAAAAAGDPNAVVLFSDPASSNYAGVSYEIQFYTAASGWIEFMGNNRKVAVFSDDDLDGVYECKLDLGVPVSGGYLLLRTLVEGQRLDDGFVLFRIP
ncbi:MAG: hypothetical protein GX945_11930, partial [Lentisphaerae bacterium]|nr:hypothetical protein [Lentisphaerota bacterium]